ncbi:DUF4158 domain-containing protein [Nonomuraea maritima]|uniref:DUF4158 domain-containing protein n=1 Tax=Nonomuraea maritima TaxID=683260 RepID=UPI003CCB84AC
MEDVDRDLIARRRSTHHQLGFALQMCTVRYIGRFLPDDLLDGGRQDKPGRGSGQITGVWTCGRTTSWGDGGRGG